MFCLEGYIISVYIVLYGWYDGIMCLYSVILNWNCYVFGSMKYVNEMCGGKNKCTVRVDYKILGDFCGGIYKYLEVIYGCVFSVMSRLIFMCEGGIDVFECLFGYVIDL